MHCHNFLNRPTNRRDMLKSGNKIEGPAIVLEMDSTTVILSGHTGNVDKFGNILITPSA